MKADGHLATSSIQRPAVEPLAAESFRPEAEAVSFHARI